MHKFLQQTQHTSFNALVSELTQIPRQKLKKHRAYCLKAIRPFLPANLHERLDAITYNWIPAADHGSDPVHMVHSVFSETLKDLRENFCAVAEIQTHEIHYLFFQLVLADFTLRHIP